MEGRTDQPGTYHAVRITLGHRHSGNGVTFPCLDWNAISAVAEIIGATAVVATLGYLALQIRQNTKVARSAARQAIAEMTMHSVSDLVGDVTLAQAFLDSLDNKPLEPAEQLRILGRCYVAMRNWEHIHYQYLNGMLSDDEWKGFRLNLSAILEWPTLQTYWENEQQFFSAAFQKEIAAIQAEMVGGTREMVHSYVLGDLPGRGSIEKSE